MRFTLGAIVFALGVALLISAWREREHVPPIMVRLGAGVTSLGAATMALARGGMTWHLVSIVLGIVAVALLLSVIVQQLRR